MEYPHRESLESLILDVGECAERVFRIDALMNSLEEGKPKEHYLEQYYQVVDLYLILCELLEQELEKAVKFETDNKLPVTFTYRQLLRDIKATLETFSKISF
jgi:hypothetical protein